MRILFLSLAALLILISSCSQEKKGEVESNTDSSKASKADTSVRAVIIESIKEKEAQLINSKDKAIDITKAQAMISLYINYVDAYPLDTIQSPKYLLKAAEIAYNANQGLIPSFYQSIYYGN